MAYTQEQILVSWSHAKSFLVEASDAKRCEILTIPPHNAQIRILLLWRPGVVAPPHDALIRNFLLWSSTTPFARIRIFRHKSGWRLKYIYIISGLSLCVCPPVCVSVENVQTVGPGVPKLGMGLDGHLEENLGKVKMTSRNYFYLYCFFSIILLFFKGTLLLIYFWRVS